MSGASARFQNTLEKKERGEEKTTWRCLDTCRSGVDQQTGCGSWFVSGALGALAGEQDGLLCEQGGPDAKFNYSSQLLAENECCGSGFGGFFLLFSVQRWLISLAESRNGSSDAAGTLSRSCRSELYPGQRTPKHTSSP